ncbi:hypothetical protein H6503_04095 [Candidatus Woesearchaeota archaeon]|nr:hypothetical protein [Candidatus Woesearchaeota archaeon]
MKLKEIIAATLLTSLTLNAQQISPINLAINPFSFNDKHKMEYAGDHDAAIAHIYQDVDFNIPSERGFLYDFGSQGLYDITETSALNISGNIILSIDFDVFTDLIKGFDKVILYHTHPNDTQKEQEFMSTATTDGQKAVVQKYFACNPLPSLEDLDFMKTWYGYSQSTNQDIELIFGIISQDYVIYFGISEEFREKFARMNSVDSSTDFMGTISALNSATSIHMMHRSQKIRYESILSDAIMNGEYSSDWIPELCRRLSNEYFLIEAKPRSEF